MLTTRKAEVRGTGVATGVHIDTYHVLDTCVLVVGKLIPWQLMDMTLRTQQQKLTLHRDIPIECVATGAH